MAAKPNMNVRTFSEGDEVDWFRLLREAYGDLDSRSIDDVRRLVKSENFIQAAFFLAEAEQKMVGSVWVKPLLRRDRYELWDLAVSREYRQSRLPGLLVDNALAYLKEVKAHLARAHTLAIEPYVSTYSEHGFIPIRRIVRIDWDLDGDLSRLPSREDVSVKDAFMHAPEKIAGIFVKALTPFWDWWIGDYGGTKELTRLSEGWFRDARFREKWFAAELEGEIVGLTGFTMGKGDVGNFFGVMVLPEYRMRYIGSTLMRAALKEAKEAGLKTLRVYTVAFLDCLAPGAILYLKSGGKTTAEYLQLEKELI